MPMSDRKLTLMYMHQDGEVIWQVFDGETEELVGVLKSDALTDAFNRPALDEVAALVEELKAKAYDMTRARVGTIIETLQGDTHASQSHPVYRLLKYTLDSIQKELQSIVERHMPQITEETLREQRWVREAREAITSSDALRERVYGLRKQADELERNLAKDRVRNRREQWFSSLQNLHEDALDEVIEATESFLDKKYSKATPSANKAESIGLPKPAR